MGNQNKLIMVMTEGKISIPESHVAFKYVIIFPGVVARAYNPSTQEAEAGESHVKSWPGKTVSAWK
jgi:hypothetical protein